MSAAASMKPDQLGEAELFTSEGRQAVRLPAGICLIGETVTVKQTPDGILLQPKAPRRFRTSEEIQAWFTRLDSYGADDLFPDGRHDPVTEPENLFD